MAFLVLPDRLRKELKKPFGQVHANASELDLESKTVICVGDRTTEEILKIGIKPKICAYDGLIERKEVGVSRIIREFEAEKIKLRNPPGSLNEESFAVFEKAFQDNKNYKIEVEGEEDLLTLAAIETAPLGTIIIYGQPGEGVVTVKIDSKTKNKIEKIIEEMRNENRDTR